MIRKIFNFGGFYYDFVGDMCLLFMGLEEIYIIFEIEEVLFEDLEDFLEVVFTVTASRR